MSHSSSDCMEDHNSHATATAASCVLSPSQVFTSDKDNAARKDRSKKVLLNFFTNVDSMSEFACTGSKSLNELVSEAKRLNLIKTLSERIPKP